MAVRIVRLGSPRAPDEGLRIGTVRHPPRGVRKEDFGRLDWYDVWYPNLAPTADAVRAAHPLQTDADWARFVRQYRATMKTPDHARSIALLAALSHQASFSVGCYCENEARCHRSILRDLLREAGARLGDN